VLFIQVLLSVYFENYLDAIWGVFNVMKVVDVLRSQSYILLFTWLVTLQENMKDTTTVFSLTLHTFCTLFTSRDSEVGSQRGTDFSALFQLPLPEPGMHAFHAPGSPGSPGSNRTAL